VLHERGVRDVEVWNAGVPGYAMADLLGFLRRRLLPLEPHVIVLQLSKNDSAVPMPLSPAFMAALGWSGLARAYMIVRFNFVRDARLFEQSFEAFVRECEAAGVRLVVATEGVPPESRPLVERLSRQLGFSLVEIGGDAYPKLPDDPHFDVVGNRRVAERLAPEIEAMRGVVR
jgi:lysophospholipase L1-like esterase